MTVANMRDELLGELKWNDELEWWEGKLALADGRSVILNIQLEKSNAESLPEQIRRTSLHIRDNEIHLREAAADNLLNLHNDMWNEGDPIDSETFVGRMSLEGITVYPDGHAEIFYEDGDLFWGHSIIVSLDSNGSVHDAQIAG